MANEYLLSFTATEINEKLHKIPDNWTDITGEIKPALDFVTPTTMQTAIAQACSQVLDQVFPVGYILTTFNDNDYNNYLGFTWEKLENTFLYADGAKSIGTSAGSETIQLNPDQIPRNLIWSDQYGVGVWLGHDATQAGGTASEPGFAPVNGFIGGTTYNRAYTLSVGNDNPRSVDNMPPYTVVRMWRRIA